MTIRVTKKINYFWKKGSLKKEHLKRLGCSFFMEPFIIQCIRPRTISLISTSTYMLTHCISSSGTNQQSNKKKKNQRLVPSRHSRSAKFCLKSDTQSSLKLPQFLTTVQNLLSMHSKLANNAKTEATLKGEKKYPCQ